MATVLRFEEYRLDLEALYGRMWDLAADDRGDGTRLYRPRPGEREALKWLVEDLSGAVADPVRSTRANNALRRQVHQVLTDLGWAERLTQVSFRLLRRGEDDAAAGLTLPALEEGAAGDEKGANAVAAEGLAIVGVAAQDLAEEGDAPVLGGLRWSKWCPLARAAREATTRPGVYLARGRGEVVYVGMAGVRRGMGVRGRLQVYARGRGAVSGLGEAALDQALADPAWVAVQLASMLADGPQRAKEWATAAIDRARLDIAWSEAPDATTARDWETRVLEELEDAALWNRARPKPAAPAT